MRVAVIAAVGLVLGCGPVWAKPDKLNGIGLMKGSCKSLIIQGKDRTSDCIGKVANTSFSSGRTGFYFTTEDGAVVTFSGMGSQQVNLDENTAISPVDKLIVGLGQAGPQDVKAVGTCRYTNPYKGPSPVFCHADTAFGAYEGSFLSDGSEPDMKKF